jgi:hypothetical protein
LAPTRTSRAGKKRSKARTQPRAVDLGKFDITDSVIGLLREGNPDDRS